MDLVWLATRVVLSTSSSHATQQEHHADQHDGLPEPGNDLRKGIALRTWAQATIMQFSLGLRWLPCMKRIRQAGRSVPISPSPW